MRYRLYSKFLMLIALMFPVIGMANLTLSSPISVVNLGIKSTSFAKDNGGNIFKSKQPMINLLFGFELFPHLHLEINTERTINSKRKATLSLGEAYLGIPMENTRTFATSMQIFSIGSDLLFKFNPLCCENFVLFIGMGGKINKINLTTKNVSIPNGSVAKLNIHNTKVILKLLGGYEYIFADNYGIRVSISWENTSSLKPMGSLINDTKIHAKLKNSFNYNIGWLFRF